MKSADCTLSLTGLGFRPEPLVLMKLMATEDLSLNQVPFVPFLLRRFLKNYAYLFFLDRKLFTFRILHNFKTVCGISMVDVHPRTTQDLSVLKMSIISARQLRLKTIFIFVLCNEKISKIKKKKIFIVLGYSNI